MDGDYLNKGRRRKREIRFRVDEEEYKKVMEKIEFSNMDISRYMRNVALKKQIIIYDFKSLFELSAQISRVGNNINQIARRLNQGGTLQKNEGETMVKFLENLNVILLDIYKETSKKI